MPKTASQLVPLKTQLANNLSLYRFADSTTDFNGSVAYQDYVFDMTGSQHLLSNPLQPNSVLTAGSTGAGPVGVSTTTLPTTTMTTPTNLTLTINNSYSTTTGLNTHVVRPRYYFVFVDSSNRESQAMAIDFNYPVGTTSGSASFNITWPTRTNGTEYAYVYKNSVGSTSGMSRVRIDYGTSSYTDNQSYTVSMSSSGSNSASWYFSLSPNSQSTAATASTAYVTAIATTTGGSWKASYYSYAVSAYNALGETLVTAEANANINGAPIIQGVSSGAMSAVTLTPSTATGALPAGKYYYKVTTWTDANYGGLGPAYTGVGNTESLPCTEVNATLGATGQITLSWTAPTNAQGFAIYRSNDLVNPTLSTAVASASGGTIPATTTYYYVVTATNANGETMASNELSATTGGGSTNSIALTWVRTPGAYGYKIYRGTGAGAENTLIGTVGLGATVTFTDTNITGTAATPPGANTATGVGLETYINQVGSPVATSYVDNGSANNSNNSGFMPPAVYQGRLSYSSVQASWTAPSAGTPTSYRLYRNSGTGTVNSSNNCNYYDNASTTYTDTGAAVTGTRYPNAANLTSNQNIVTVGRYMLLPTPVSSSSPYPYITRIGATFTPVAGKQYRFFIFDASSQTTRYTSAFFTATTSSPTYYEVTPNLQNSFTGNYLWIGVQGADSGAYVTWNPTTSPSNASLPNTLASDNGTWYDNQPNYTTGGSSFYYPGNNSQNQNGTLTPLGPSNEATAGGFPLKIVYRQFLTGSSINGTKGTFLGGTRWSQYAYSTNTTYTTPVKSIVPSWNVSAPAISKSDQVTFAGKYATVEVSQDGGNTYTALTNGQRYVFPTAATQLMYRYTVAPAGTAWSMDSRLMTLGSLAPGAYVNGYNFYFTGDTSNGSYYYYNYGNQQNDVYMQTQGVWQIGVSTNNWVYPNITMQGFSIDADITMSGYFSGSGNFGIRFRHDGSVSYGGYYAYIDNSGNCGLIKVGQNTTSTTSLATVSGAVPSQNGLVHTLRVVCVGTTVFVFANGRLVIQYTLTDTGLYLTGANIGMSGNGGANNGNNVTSFRAYPLTSAYQATYGPTVELEYVSVYLET